ncbi:MULTISPECIES: metallophosphoesterase [Cupriavidus]|uniref:metallophosphoesterase n=1 Tax=Cupriavidus TaxID=106589 RepID=UPI00157A849C|nr:MULTISPECIES: metallophosphoesterase [Cupriavidus]MBB1632619.1 hypothetical protein [Cupriavidus sp. UME77]NUA27050.1 hypothetical protein [Cupriavidus basilensis]
MNASASVVWPLVGAKPLPRIHVLSDLHLETGAYEIPADLEYDILIAAGDMGPVELSIPWLASLGKPVVYVMGNHEYYGREWHEVLPAARAAAKGTQVHVLERGSVVIGGIRFLGATLWSNFGGWHAGLVANARQYLNDYRQIRATHWHAQRRNRTWLRRCYQKIAALPESENIWFDPAIAYAEHLRSVTWLEGMLTSGLRQPTIVVTHHAPSFASLREFGVAEHNLCADGWEASRNAGLRRVAAYASDRDAVLAEHRERILCWVHGHLHHRLDVLAGGVRVLCNPRGYARKPITAADAALRQLFGAPVSAADVERSQAMHRLNPYLGDGIEFDNRLLLDLEDGLALPAARRIRVPLSQLEAIAGDTCGLMSKVTADDNLVASCVRRVICANSHAFQLTLDEIVSNVGDALDWRPRAVQSTLEKPQCSPVLHLLEDVVGGSEALRERISEHYACLEAWIAWAKTLPIAAARALQRWGAAAYALLNLVHELGFDARIERPSIDALRSVSESTTYRLYIDADPTELNSVHRQITQIEVGIFGRDYLRIDLSLEAAEGRAIWGTGRLLTREALAQWR